MTPGGMLGGRYELETRLGKGGMGEVWRARDIESGELVAVKVLLKELAEDRSFQRRFVREARAAAAVKHRNVVELRAIDEGDDGCPFLVMELLCGETLGQRLKRRAGLSVAETAAILLPVFDAIETAHTRGLVHRDLKPENVFLANEPVTGNVRVCVLDFGIAKYVEKLAAPTVVSADTTTTLVTTGTMLGTPYYMAPEQVLGERDIDGLADVWALGIILYECVTGQRPTEAATLGSILKIILTGGIAPIAEVAPGLDASLARAIMRMLRTERAERATLAEVRATLERELPEGFVLEAAPAENDGPRDSRVRNRFHPRRGLLALSVLAAVIVAGLFSAWSLGGRTTATDLRAPAKDLANTNDVEPAAREAQSTELDRGASGDAVAVLAAHSVSSASAASATMTPKIRRAARSLDAGAPASSKHAASSDAPPTVAPSRGPSGLVADNPFGGSP